MKRIDVQSLDATRTDSEAMSVKIAYSMAALWIFGGAAYFYIRFSVIFLNDNRAAIDGLLQRIQSIASLG